MSVKAEKTAAIVHARPPSYVSCASLALELDVSESTVRALVEKGVLPRPIRIEGNVRWRWEDVNAALGGIVASGGNNASDPYMSGARNATAKR